ncbi:MAG: YccF domain-containing protein [Rhodospirillales bacterium]
MSLVRLVLNVLWILTGGAWMAVGWLIAAVLMVITIVGLPWARAAFNIASYTLLPFGRVAVPRDLLQGRGDLGTGALGTLGNVLWLVLAGWWLALGHLLTAIGLALTIIGIPFAWAHLKLAGVSLWPVGRAIVTTEEAERLQGGSAAGFNLSVGGR